MSFNISIVMDVTSAALVVAWVEGRLALVLPTGLTLTLSLRGPWVWRWGCYWLRKAKGRRRLLWRGGRLSMLQGHLLWLPRGCVSYFLVLPPLWELTSNDDTEELEDGDADANSADKICFIADKLADLGVAPRYVPLFGQTFARIKKVIGGHQS